MVGASVPDIALEPDKTVKKVLDKFRLELNDEAAVKHMQELIDISGEVTIHSSSDCVKPMIVSSYLKILSTLSHEFELQNMYLCKYWRETICINLFWAYN